MQAGIGFIIIGGVFVWSLLSSIIKLMNYDWDNNSFSAVTLLKVFKVSIISLLALIIFIAYVLPYLDQ